MRIVVIGIGGVGMAHICAAVRCGFEIIALVDTSSSILKQATGVWENRWLDTHETVPVQKGTHYLPNMNGLLKIGSLRAEDLIIIATPPHTHEAIINFCLKYFPSCILVEKPIAMVSTNLSDDRLHLSTEWIYHSKTFPSPINTISMRYPKASTTDWGYALPAVLDFCPHLFSIILHNGYFFTKITPIKIRKDVFELVVEEENGKKINLSGGRLLDEPLDFENHFGLFVNGVLFDWEEDLFDKQLLSIQKGSKGVEWNLLQQLENQVKKYLS